MAGLSNFFSNGSSLVLLPQLRLRSRGAKLINLNCYWGTEAGGFSLRIWNGHSIVVHMELRGTLELPVMLY